MSLWIRFLSVMIILFIVPIIDSAKTASPISKTTSTKVDLRTKKATSKSTKATTKHIESNLLPKLLPHPDTCYLLEFHHDDCDHAEQMEPVLKRLEDDLDTKVRRININTRKEFFSLLSTVGHDECGSFPFYYNRRTGQAICGATSYSNLRSWGTGEIGHMFHEPPENMHDRESRGSGRKHEVGFKGFFSEKMSRQPKKRSASTSDKSPSKSTTTTTPSKQSKSGKQAVASTAGSNEDGSKGKFSSSSKSSNEKVTKPVAGNKATTATTATTGAASRMEERKARRQSKRQLASTGK